MVTSSSGRLQAVVFDCVPQLEWEVASACSQAADAACTAASQPHIRDFSTNESAISGDEYAVDLSRADGA
jgi:hypothetical protein